jgi:hypothetical protein
MNNFYRWHLYIPLMGVVLVLLVIFRNFVLGFFLEPIALLLWAAWRVILSVDQTVWWGLLIFAIFLLALRFIPTESGGYQRPNHYDDTTHGNNGERLAYWSRRIQASAGKEIEREALRQDFMKLITAILLLREKLEPAQAQEAIRDRQIPVPESVYAFLFPGEPADGNNSRPARARPSPLFQNWIKRVRFANKQGYQRNLYEVVCWIETLLEMDHNERIPKLDDD